jgi:hypothetical protein
MSDVFCSKVKNMSKEIVLSTSKVNSYGFRVMTEGINLDQYRKNPILLWNHSRPYRGTTDEVLPIGKIENLRIEGDQLIGTPVFDENDKFALKIKTKYETGIIRMSSIGFDVIETSEDPLLILQGQRRATVTKAKLVEVSLTDIGANDDALVLYKDGHMVNLSKGDDKEIVPILTLTAEIKNQNSNNHMKIIALKLGLSETATEGEVLEKITELQNKAGRSEQLQKQIDEQLNSAIEQSVTAAIKQKKITADKHDHFVLIGKTSGLQALNTTLEIIEPAVKPSSVINGKVNVDKEYKKLSEVPEAELIEMRKNDVKTYRELFKAEYGYDVTIEN